MNTTPLTLVLGGGIVGTAAAWDLSRRGHEVVIADRDPAVAAAAGEALGVGHLRIDAADRAQIAAALPDYDAVIAAVPFSLGFQLAAAAVTAGCHYFDFGGNPRIVKEQLRLGPVAQAGDVAVVPDCGLAPGVANVIAAAMIAASSEPTVDSVQIRVGCLPQDPVGALGYLVHRSVKEDSSAASGATRATLGVSLAIRARSGRCWRAAATQAATVAGSLPKS